MFCIIWNILIKNIKKIVANDPTTKVVTNSLGKYTNKTIRLIELNPKVVTSKEPIWSGMLE